MSPTSPTGACTKHKQTCAFGYCYYIESNIDAMALRTHLHRISHHLPATSTVRRPTVRGRCVLPRFSNWVGQRISHRPRAPRVTVHCDVLIPCGCRGAGGGLSELWRKPIIEHRVTSEACLGRSYWGSLCGIRRRRWCGLRPHRQLVLRPGSVSYSTPRATPERSCKKRI